MTKRIFEAAFAGWVGAAFFLVVLSTAGGIFGLSVGIAIPMAVQQFAGMRTIVTMTSLFLSFGISVSVGIIFGLYPATRAASLDPIEALRHE